MKKKFTPGPWHAEDFEIIGADGYGITAIPDCEESSGGNPVVDRANLNLIVAAPEMFAALERCLNDDAGDLEVETVHLAREAIRKARGGK